MTPFDLGISAQDLLLALLVVAVGCALQAAIGFGSALIAAPLLLLVDRTLVPGPLLLSSVVLTVLMAWADWRGVDFRGLGWALIGRAASTPVAALAVSLASARVFDVGFGLLVLAGVWLSWAGLKLTPTPSHNLLAGALSGVMGTISSVGGPPIALVYQRASGPTMRGTLSVFFSVGSLLSIAGLAWVGQFGAREWWLGAILSPAAVAGFAFTHRVVGPRNSLAARFAALLLSAVAGAMTLARGLY